MIKHAKDLIRGGLADSRPDSDFNPEELKKGIDIELEHVNDRKRSKEIAKDHLAEIPDYYTRLVKMEEEAEEQMGKGESKTKKILVTANKPDKVSVAPVKTSALRRAEVLSIMAGKGFGTEKTARKHGKPCPGGKIRSKGKGRGMGYGKGKGPIGVPVGEKQGGFGLSKGAGKVPKGLKTGVKSLGKLLNKKKSVKSMELLDTAMKKGIKSKKGGKAYEKFRSTASKKTIKHLKKVQKGLGAGEKMRDTHGKRIKLGSARLLSVFLQKALTPNGSSRIIKQASDRERAARVLAAVYKAARVYGR